MKKSTSTDFNSLLEYLFDLQRLGIKVGLEHTEQLLDICGNPQNTFRSIHVAGTNGKGSTCAIIASILRNSGYKIGLYTSPHLIRFNERIRVNGIPIPDDEIVSFVKEFKPTIDKIQSTFFEVTTALAFSYFAQQKVDVAVIETGLGGRLDSTNVLKPNVTVITPVALDHTEILGKELKDIAFEKAGIIKREVPLVLAPQVRVVKNVISNTAKTRKAPVKICEGINKIELSENGTSFQYGGETLKTGLLGEHQALNSVLAVEAAKLFDKNIRQTAVVKGLKYVNWPGRLQKMVETDPVYYDVAHNPHGIQVLVNTFSKIFDEKPIGIFALKGDKELDKIAPVLKNSFEELIVTSVPGRDLMPSEELKIGLVGFGVSARSEANLNSAVDYVVSVHGYKKPVILFGSHYISSAVYEKFGFSFDKGII